MASPLKLLAFTDRSAYCPRERMMLTIDIKNLPLSQAYQTTVFLVQTISFKSRCGKSRTDRCQRKLIQRSSLSWAVDELEVPDVPPTIRSCGILSVTYHVKVDIRLTEDWLNASLTEGTRDGRTEIDKVVWRFLTDWWHLSLFFVESRGLDWTLSEVYRTEHVNMVYSLIWFPFKMCLTSGRYSRSKLLQHSSCRHQCSYLFPSSLVGRPRDLGTR